MRGKYFADRTPPKILLIFFQKWSRKADGHSEKGKSYFHNNSYPRSANLYAEGIMDVTKILAELREEREQVEQAILTLERLARGRGRRRGRPPSWMAEITRKRGRPPGSKNKAAVSSPAKAAVA
jgi:hypothetical protein